MPSPSGRGSAGTTSRRDISAAGEGVPCIGRAQGKARVPRTRKRIGPATGRASPEPVGGTAMVNAFHVHLVGDGFGPRFIRFRPYFPYSARLRINGRGYLKRRMEKRPVPSGAPGSGIMGRAGPAAMRDIAGETGAGRIGAPFRRWLARPAHPFTTGDRAKGIRHDLPVLQAERALTQVSGRPASGRVPFGETIRGNPGIGRADRVRLTFGRRVTRRTGPRFRTRVMTGGVPPSPRVDHRRPRIRQHFREGRAPRTGTVTDDTYGFGARRRPRDPDDLREAGFRASRRPPGVQRISHGRPTGAGTFDAPRRPAVPPPSTAAGCPPCASETRGSRPCRPLS